MLSTVRRNVRCTTVTLFVIGLFAPGGLSAQRLPTSVVPVNYKLFLDPNITARTVSGEETIHVRVAQPVTEFVLNSLDLDITAAEVTTAGKKQPARIVYDKAAEMVRLVIGTPVPAGSSELHLKFSGRLTEGLRGLYLSKSPRRMYAVTQFEGTYARMMFPCFDEPGFKATFDMSVLADKGDTAISNGRIIADEPLPGSSRHKITFSTSPRMSSYLLALAIGDWRCLERTVDGIPVRVCATPERKNAGKFALEAATRSLEFFNHWYGIKYPFGKMDMVAIPDYEWGGMENTAAIFFRENALLLNEDEDKVSASARQGHAGTIAHEIAHQWFGDLVTAAWWDDIWLNEGFASWMQSKPIEAWHPEWKLEAASAAAAQQIISLDSLASARAIHGNPRTSGEIKEMFDGITYEKGAAVLRMLEAYLGPDVFRKGVNQYLQEHANGNATSNDFWRVMTQVSGKPVDKIMPSFVLQPGVPVVSIGSSSCQTGHISLHAEQQRFYISTDAGNPASAQKWDIPICLKTEGGTGATCTLLSGNKQQLDINGCPGWYFANREAKGYYRVFYDDGRNLTRIADVAEKELTVSERIALVEDSWAMARSGKSPITLFLDVVQMMRSERERLVVSLMAAHLQEAGALVSDQRKDDYERFVRLQFGPLAEELGWETRPGDTDEQKILRARLLTALGATADPGALALSQKLVQQYLREPGSTDATLTDAAFAVAAAHGDAGFYETLSAALGKATSSEEYNKYLFALANFRRPELVERTLQLVFEGKVRQQDYPALFAVLLENPVSRASAWNYLKSHWEALAEKVTSFGGRGAVQALGSFCSAQQKDDVKQFFASHRAPGADRALQQSLEAMDNCIKFRQAQQANMEKWLTQQQ